MRKPLYLFILLSLISLLTACSFSFSTDTISAVATSSYPVTPITHRKRWLIDRTGRVVLFHGVNLVVKSPPYEPASVGFNFKDANWLSQNGFNLVRLGVLMTGIMPEPGVIDNKYLNSIKSTVNLLWKYHIYVLLDFHQDGFGPSLGGDGMPSYMTLTDHAINSHLSPAASPYYESNPSISQAFQSFWNDQKSTQGIGIQHYYYMGLSATSSVFSNSDGVLGYDIMNEPWPGLVWKQCLNPGCPQLDEKELLPFYSAADKAIRKYDKSHLIFEEPFVLYNFGESSVTLPLPNHDQNSGLSFHQYAPTYNQELTVLHNALLWSKSTNGTLIDSEWGATNIPILIDVQANELDSYLIPWIFWSLNGTIIKNMDASPSGSNLDIGVVNALVRPYPMVIAGTPKSLSYDSNTHELKFMWSTKNVNGGNFKAGSLTSIEVPKITEPNGYLVTVLGGHVVSKPCSSLLNIAQDNGSTSLTVIVKPNNNCAVDK